MKFLTLAFLASCLVASSAQAAVSASVRDISETLTLLPFATVSTTTLDDIGLKEDVQQVEADAYNFLAGEGISLALGEQMNKMRETFPELANSSDEEVIALMLEMAKI